MATDERTAFELEYWKLVLADLLALNDLVKLAAERNMDVPVACLYALTAPEAGRLDYLQSASTASRETMDALAEMYGPINRLVQLVDGRVQALGEAA